MIEFAAVSKNKENLRNGNNIKPCLSATKEAAYRNEYRHSSLKSSAILNLTQNKLKLYF